MRHQRPPSEAERVCRARLFCTLPIGTQTASPSLQERLQVGTSGSRSLPTGGEWTRAKKIVTRSLRGEQQAGRDIAAACLRATGGFAGRSKGAMKLPPDHIADALSDLLGFFQEVLEHGVAAALQLLKLEEYLKRRFTEVLAAVVDHATQELEPATRELVRTVMLDTIADVFGDSDDGPARTALEKLAKSLDFPNLLARLLNRILLSYLTAQWQRHIDGATADEKPKMALRKDLKDAVQESTFSVLGKRQPELEKTDWRKEAARALLAEIVSLIEKDLRKGSPE